VKNSGPSDRKARQDFAFEIIFGKIDLSWSHMRAVRLPGPTLTKFLKQFHALQREISTGLKMGLDILLLLNFYESRIF
jgi:hypothetical protein